MEIRTGIVNSVNGFHGSAVFNAEQEFSTISKRLVEGLPRTVATVGGKEYPQVSVRINIGSLCKQMNLDMLILEEAVNIALQPDETLRDCSFDVIFGNDFVLQKADLAVEGHYNAKVKTKTGLVPVGIVLFGDIKTTKFEMKHFSKTNYGGDMDDRVIIFFDMDYFTLQIHEEKWQRRNARVLLNPSNMIVGASYEAKLRGINRNSTPYLKGAQDICPGLIEIKRKQSDSSIEASAKIVRAIESILGGYDSELTKIEFSSPDELYIDITDLVNQPRPSADSSESPRSPAVKYLLGVIQNLLRQNPNMWSNTYLYTDTVQGPPTKNNYILGRLETLRKKKNVGNSEQEIRLMYGSAVAYLIVEAIRNDTGYHSSVGIACNKLISKIASGLHQDLPSSITILPPSGLNTSSAYVAIENIPGLDSKVLDAIKNQFGSSFTMANLQSLSETPLATCAIYQGSGRSSRNLGLDEAKRVLNLAFGICDKPVFQATLSKTYEAKEKLYGEMYDTVEIRSIFEELTDRFLEQIGFQKREHSRIPKQIEVSISLGNRPEMRGKMKNPTGALREIRQFFKDFIDDCMCGWKYNFQVEEVKVQASF